MAGISFGQEIVINSTAIEEIVSSDMPVVPDPLPADPEAAIPILNGVLIGDVNPDLAHLSDAIYRTMTAQKDWGSYISKIRDLDEAETAGNEYARVMNESFVAERLRDGRARTRDLNKLKADIDVRLHALRLQANRAAAGAFVAAAPAAVAPRHYAPSAPRRFDGKHKEFLQFTQMFENTIGASALSNVEKLSRLLGLLDGEPKRLLAGLLVTDANYPVAQATLARRYGDTERTARELKAELNSLAPARSTHEVREIQIKSESLIQQLSSLGHPPASEETMWMLESKLPRRCLEKLMDEKKAVTARAAPNNVWDLTQFRSSLEEIVKVEENIGGIIYAPSSGPSHQSSRAAPAAKTGRRTFNAVSVKIDAKSGGKSSTYRPKSDSNGMKGAKMLSKAGAKVAEAKPVSGCTFCYGNHKAYLCPLSNVERKNKILASKCCLKCLRPGHWASNCNAEPCRRCSRSHHTYLCDKNNVQNSNKIPLPLKEHKFGAKPVPFAKATNNVTISCDADKSEPALKSVTGMATRPRAKALMMCVTASVFNPITFLSAEVPIFIDSGSSESYITKKLAKFLGIKVGPSQLIEVSRFGDDKGDLGPMNLLTESARFCIRGLEGDTFTVDSLTVDRIIGALTQVPEVDESVYTDRKIELPTASRPPQVMLGSIFCAIEIAL